MTRFALLCVAACLATCALTGCAPRTLSYSPHEHTHQWKKVMRVDRMALSEDLDILLQADRPTRLTRWHDR